MGRILGIHVYYCIWWLCIIISTIANILNVRWNETNIVLGVIYVLIVIPLQSSALEFLMQTAIALRYCGVKTRRIAKESCDGITVMLNYNLLATDTGDIDECLHTMYEAYMGNLSANVVAVLVSATKTEELRNFEITTRDWLRQRIFAELYIEGIHFIKNDAHLISPHRLRHVWVAFSDIDKTDFILHYLSGICDYFARNFMVIHRNSSVLRKCGQYQDLMLLSAGETKAFSYCDEKFYGKSARIYGEYMFQESEDADNITGRHFDYTLVLDSDTIVVEGVAFELLEIAAAHPHKGIIQPAIKFIPKSDDSVYMWLETTRQSLFEPITNSMATFLGQCGYYGKALIKNEIYIRHVIGTRDNIIERVPVDVLSHDTFEAAILTPMYVGTVFLIETPCFNYVTWYLRETRWNKGELILATYFWKNVFGKPINFLKRICQGNDYEETILRTETNFDTTSSYIAHGALRQVAMKPLLLISVFLHIGIYSHFPDMSLLWVIVLVLVIPKIGIFRPKNIGKMLIETLLSVLQFTPEAVTGTVRICQAIRGLLFLNVKWIPQRAVEEEFKKSNIIISSFKHLWSFSVFAVIVSLIVFKFRTDYFFTAMMLTVFLLPVFNCISSLNIHSVAHCGLLRRRLTVPWTYWGRWFRRIIPPTKRSRLASESSTAPLIGNEHV